MCERWRQYLALRIVLAFFIHVSLLAAREDHFSLKRIFSGSMSGLRVVPWDAPLSPYMAKGKVEGWRDSESSNFCLIFPAPLQVVTGLVDVAELKRSAQICLTYQFLKGLAAGLW